MPRLPWLPRPALGALAFPAALAAAPAWAADAPAPIVAVTVTDKGCEPSTLTVPSGKSTFKIKNASRRTLEWEILQGVKVVEERENIAPGFSATLTANLSAGEYQMTCGLLSNAKGTLKVAGGAAAAAAPAVGLSKQIAEYNAYVVGETDALVAATAKFVAAVKAGNLEEAQKLYAPARVHYERIEPVAELFDDLDSAMDARVDDFENKEKDPKWTGFHRMEYVLFQQKTTTGLAPLADKLAADTVELRKRLDTLEIPPKAMVGGAADLIEEVASKKIAGEEDRYSRTDLWDFQANVDGAQKIWSLVKPMVSDSKATLATRIDEQFAKVDTILAKYKTADGFKSYDALSKADRNALRGPITVLAEDLSQLRGILGVE